MLGSREAIHSSIVLILPDMASIQIILMTEAVQRCTKIYHLKHIGVTTSSNVRGVKSSLVTRSTVCESRIAGLSPDYANSFTTFLSHLVWSRFCPFKQRNLKPSHYQCPGWSAVNCQPIVFEGIYRVSEHWTFGVKLMEYITCLSDVVIRPKRRKNGELLEAECASWEVRPGNDASQKWVTEIDSTWWGYLEHHQMKVLQRKLQSFRRVPVKTLEKMSQVEMERIEFFKLRQVHRSYTKLLWIQNISYAFIFV